MDKPLGVEDFAAMEGQLRGCVEADRHYWQVNDVKCDAIHTAKTYEEFAEAYARPTEYWLGDEVKCDVKETVKTYEEFVDRVAAAHLRPLEKADYKQKRPRGWNQFAAGPKL